MRNNGYKLKEISKLNLAEEFWMILKKIIFEKNYSNQQEEKKKKLWLIIKKKNGRNKN